MKEAVFAEALLLIVNRVVPVRRLEDQQAQRRQVKATGLARVLGLSSVRRHRVPAALDIVGRLPAASPFLSLNDLRLQAAVPGLPVLAADVMEDLGGVIPLVDVLA